MKIINFKLNQIVFENIYAVKSKFKKKKKNTYDL